jgi:hypothetical protein
MEETGKMTHNHTGRAAASVGSESATFLRPSVPPSSRNDYDTDISAYELLVCRVPVLFPFENLSIIVVSLFEVLEIITFGLLLVRNFLKRYVKKTIILALMTG